MIKNFNTWLTEGNFVKQNLAEDWGGFLKNTNTGPMKEIEDFCEKYDISNYTIHEDDWSISVNGGGLIWVVKILKQFH